MSAGTNTSKLKRTLLSPERSEVGQSASALCRTHRCAAKATQPGRRKPGGQVEADSIRLSAVPHTSVGGQPGNTNALKLKRT